MPTEQDYDRVIAQDNAARNVASVSGVPSSAAVGAINNASVTGVPPEVAMHDPEGSNAQADTIRQNQAISENPYLRSFAGKSSSDWAAAKDNLPAVQKISNLAQGYMATGGPFGDVLKIVGNTWQDLQANIKKGEEIQQNPSGFFDLRGYGNLLHTMGDVVGLTPPGIAFGAAQEWLARGEAGVLPSITPFSFTGGYGAPATDYESKLQLARQNMAVALWGVRPAGVAPPPRITDAEWRDVTPQPPSPEITGPQLRLPSPEEITAAPVAPPGEHPPTDAARGIFADIDAGNITKLQEAVQEAKLPPVVAMRLLEEHFPGQTVSVDPDVIFELATKDEHPFPTTYESQAVRAAQDGDKVEMPLALYIAATAGHPSASVLNRATTFREGGFSQDDAQENKGMAPSISDTAIPKPAPMLNLQDMEWMDDKHLGSNPGGIYTLGDEAFSVKGQQTPNPEIARQEVLAAALMKEAGIPAPETQLVNLGDKHGGGIGVASKWEDGLTPIKTGDLMGESKQALYDQFATHAWLSNRDIAGLGSDTNLFQRPNGQIVNIDPGGALSYRAMGAKKTDFGTDPIEWETMRQEKYPAGKLFSGMTALDAQASAMHLAKVSDEKIRQHVAQLGITEPGLADTLIARKNAILEKAGLPVEEEQKPFVFPQDFPKEAETQVLSAMSGTKQKIDQVFRSQFMNSMFTDPKALGMTKEQFNLHADKIEQAKAEVQQKLFEKALAEVKKYRTKEFKEAYEKHYQGAIQDTLMRPDVHAYHALKVGEPKKSDLSVGNSLVDANNNPLIFYHGTGFTDIETWAIGPWSYYPVISFTLDPKFADMWAKGKVGAFEPFSTSTMDETQRHMVYIVNLVAKHAADYDKPEDVERAAKWYEAHPKANPRAAYHGGANLRNLLREGNWPLWEWPPMWKDCGWDAAFVVESALAKRKNIAIANGNQVFFRYREAVIKAKQKIHSSFKDFTQKSVLDRMPSGIFSPSGDDGDQVAFELGFDSAQDMFRAIADLEDYRKSTGKSFKDMLLSMFRDEAQRRAEKEVGFDLSPESMLQATSEVARTVTVEDFLASEVQQLAEMANKPFSKEDMKYRAEVTFDNLLVEQALKPQKFEERVYRAGRKAEIALLKNDFQKAFIWKQKQFLLHLQLKLSFNYKKEFEKDDKALTRWGKEKVSSIEPNVAAVLEKLAQQLHYPMRRDALELDRYLLQGPYKSVNGLANHLNLSGIPVEPIEIPPELYGVSGKVPLKLSVEDFRQVMDTAIAMETFGRDGQKILLRGKEVELTQIAEEVRASAGGIGARYTSQELQNLRRGKFNALRYKVKSVLVDNWRPEVYLHWADGDKQGALMHSVVNPLMGGKHLETKLTDEWVKAMRNSGDTKFFQAMDTKLQSEPLMLYNSPTGPLQVLNTVGDFRVALLHLGNNIDREKLLQGHGWGEEQEKWLVSHATEADWKFCQTFWEQNEKHFQLADKMYMDLRGKGLKKKQPRMIETPFGEIKGGYIHLDYDSGLKNIARLAKMEQGEEEAQDLFANFPAAALPSAGYSKPVTKFFAPVSLDYHLLSLGVAEAIHDISFRKAMIQAQRVVRDPRIAHMLDQILGPEFTIQMLPWLRYIAQERIVLDPATEGTAQVARDLISNISFAKMAYDLTASLKHGGVGFNHMMTEVDNPVALTQAAMDTLNPGPKGQHWREFIDQNSGEVAGLALNIDNNLREAITRDALASGPVHDYKRFGFFLFTLSKLVESRITWLAKYRIEVGKNGNHEDAVAIADKAVRDTQGAGAPVDVPPILRRGLGPGEFFRLLVGMFMSFHLTTASRLFTMQRQVGLGLKLLAGGGGGKGPPDLPPWEIDRQIDRDIGEGFSNLQKAGKSGIGFLLLPAIWLAFFQVYIAGFEEKKKTKVQTFFDELLWGLSDQTLGSFIPLSRIEAALHYGADRPDLFSGIVEDFEKFGLMTSRSLAYGMMGVGALTGLSPDTAAHVVQAIIDEETPGRLKPDEAGVAPFLQRALLGRYPRYNTARSGRSITRRVR